MEQPRTRTQITILPYLTTHPPLIKSPDSYHHHQLSSPFSVQLARRIFSTMIHSPEAFPALIFYLTLHKPASADEDEYENGGFGFWFWSFVIVGAGRRLGGDFLVVLWRWMWWLCDDVRRKWKCAAKKNRRKQNGDVGCGFKTEKESSESRWKCAAAVVIYVEGGCDSSL